MAAIRLVAFDLDGTLVDSVPDLAVAIDLVCRDLGLRQPGAVVVRHWVGDGVRRLVKRAVTGGVDDEPDAQLFERGMALFRRHYRDHLSDHTHLYPEVRAVLDELHASGLRLACVTNKSGEFTVPLLAALDLQRYFGAVVSGDTLAVRKPDPEPLLHAARALAVAPAAACMVGDSANDMRAARAAGFLPLGVNYGYGDAAEAAAMAPATMFGSLAELPPWVAAYNRALAVRAASR
ncbi:MAG: phosphoglycolate phosphatase [Gammaproteobacteria bacterium]|nr:phosphoglycolate phosphatase [Gammaproteobacteria bacterium]MDE2023108.1 phosphoglycolate phosphatase [Gammaproteobacteria bacterium]MDE2139629.1 phosphoglycolate phosphatase [Gammaproteobacteria bacterium]